MIFRRIVMRQFTKWGGRLATAVCVLSLALICTGRLFAQANAGITGTVTDSSGAVVSDGTVTIRNEGTGVENHTNTSSAGTYSVTGLIPGIYTVTVEASGFKKAVH